MKSKEEIEKLAAKKFAEIEVKGKLPTGYYDYPANKWIKEIWINAFIECQELQQPAQVEPQAYSIILIKDAIHKIELREGRSYHTFYEKLESILAAYPQSTQLPRVNSWGEIHSNWQDSDKMEFVNFLRTLYPDGVIIKPAIKK